MSAAAAAAFAAASMASTLRIYVYASLSRFVSAGWGCSPALPRRDARVAAGCPAGLAVPVGGRHAFRGCPKIADTRRCRGALQASASGSLRKGPS